ncbi:MAG: amidohydrolase [Rhodoglobus sp.]
MILRNSRLGDDLVDLRIVEGRIAEVGAIDEPGLDLGGRWVLPGLWDQHVHFSQWAMSRQRVDVSGARSAAETAVLVAGAPRPPAGLVLVGVGYRDGLWPDEPTLAVLDAAAPDTPVVLISADLHSCWLNSIAAARFGVVGPLLREQDCFAVVSALDDVPEDLLDGWVDDAGRAAAARGVVGVVDLEMAWNTDNWLRRMDAGFDTLRVSCGIYPQFLDRALAAGYSTGTQLAPLLQVGPFKILTDGSLNTRTAYCVDPYPGMGEYRGLLTVEPTDLIDWLRRAKGFTPAVHAIGDEANRLALDAFERLGIGGRIEHAQLVSAGDFARFAELGVIASVQPEQAMDDRDVAERYWAGRTERSFALASLYDAGATLVLGSDAPVAPLDPWVTMAAAVWRSRGREPWHPEQRISAGVALAASVCSSVEVGAVADLAVVELDPLTASEEQLRGMPVAATLLAGRLTHSTL